MTRSRLNWAVEIVAPWALAAALLVSFTADAGQNWLTGTSLLALDEAALTAPEDLAPSLAPSANSPYRAFSGLRAGRGLLREARLAISPRESFSKAVDESAPSAALKPKSWQFPVTVSRGKSDPAVALRPSFDSQMQRPAAIRKLVSRDLIFRIDDTSVASTFTLIEPGHDGPESVSRFEPWGQDEAPTAMLSNERWERGGASPNANGVSITYRPQALVERLEQGATPAASQTAKLSTRTPVSEDQRPVVVPLGGSAIVATATPRSEPVGYEPARATRDYLSAIDPARIDSEKKCLAEGVYFEARSEPEDGQAAVAQVILNRVVSGLYPSTICGVVYQNRHHYKGCQFSFACEGKSLRVNEPESWRTAVRVAEEVLRGGRWLEEVGFSTHYHARYVRPRWARYLTKMDVIGKHIFYRLKPGQT